MRSIRLAALTVAMTLAFSGLVLAWDHDDDHDRDKHADRHHDRDHDRDRDHRSGRDWNWDRSHDRDHNGWWNRDRDRDRDHDRDDGYYRGGSVYNRYPRGYPGGYGYPSGGYGYPGGDYGNPGRVYGNSGGNIGYNTGYADGSYRAREDISENKPFNPNPRGSFGNRDHGYHSSYGDKNYYRSQYTSGYEAGYQSNYRGGRGRGWGF
jgi:hypothetical protein